VTLWGVNFQSCLYWEFHRMARCGVPMTAEAIKKTTDETLDGLVRMKCGVIRAHLTPADFTDGDGNLVENLWLDMMD